MVHGHASNKNGKSIFAIAEELTKRKINTLRIDVDGCGESEGKFEDQTISSGADDILSAINFVKEKGYSTINLFGSSCGGLMVMAAALQEPEIKKIGLKAPVSDYPAQWLRKYGQKTIDGWKEKGYRDYKSGKGEILKINYSFIEDCKKYVMVEHAHKIKVPVLIIHGTVDDKVNIEDSRKLVISFPNGKLIELEGADHGLDINGDRTKSLKIFGDWFEDRLMF